MNLEFAIRRVIITLLMFKPAASETCEVADWRDCLDREGWSLCPQIKMYLRGFWRSAKLLGDERVGRLEEGRCCEADEPSYAIQLSACLNANWTSTLDGFNVWALCPASYYLNGLRLQGRSPAFLPHIKQGQCCRPQNHPNSYEDCYDEDVTSSFDTRGWSECWLAGYYMTGFYKSNCNYLHCIDKLRCCKMKKVQTDSRPLAATTRTKQRQQDISTAYGPTTTSGLTFREITIVSAFGSLFFIVVAALAAICFKEHWAGCKPNIPDDLDEEEIQPYASVHLSRIFPLNDESNGPGNNDIPLETLPSQLRTPQEERTELGNSRYKNANHLGKSSVTPVEYLFYQPRYENEAVDSESRNVVMRPGYDKLTPATTNPPCEYDSLIRERDLRCKSRRGDIRDTEGEDNMNTHTIVEVPTTDERTPACSMDKKKNQENSLGKIKSECIENVWKKETLI